MSHLKFVGAIILALAMGASAIATIGANDTSERDARVGARPLQDGRIEFALQLATDTSDMLQEEQARTTRTWGDRILPRVRMFPAEPTSNGWHSSSPPILVGDVETRIRARRLDDGRTEFALQQRSDGETWADHIYPDGRYLSASHRTSHIGRWLNSSPVTVAASVVVPEVVVPDGVPIVAAAVLERAELDGWSYNGSEPSFYYGVREDPLDDTYDTWIVRVAKTDDNLYDTLRLQVSCYAGEFGITLWESALPYQTSDRRVRVSYRFDDGEVRTENWDHYSSGEDGFYPPDPSAFAAEMMGAR